METKGYKMSRALIQLFSLFVIMINIGIIIYSLYYSYLIEIERLVMERYYVTYYDTGLYLLGFNILFGLFASCGITSKKKSIMAIYSHICKIYIFIGSILTAYLYFFYITTYGTSLSNSMVQLGPVNQLIAIKTGINNMQIAPIRVKTDMNRILNIFSGFQFIVIVLQIIQLFLISYAMSIKLTSISSVAPPITKISRLGLNTESLKKKRIVEVTV